MAAASKWSIRLNNGTILPALGLGTSKIENIEHSISVAVKAGYRSIDGALLYNNGKRIGNALQSLYKEGMVRREDMFLSSKLLCFELHSAKQDVKESCQRVLADYQTNYIDLFLLHFPVSLRRGASMSTLTEDDIIIPYSEDTIAAVWEGMEELVQRGMARNIGVCNFFITKIENLLKTAKIVPAVNQVECHAFFQQPKPRAYMKSKGIAVQAFYPIGAPTRLIINPNDPVLLEDPVINEIATKHKATPAQVCISFLLHIGVSPIPKSGTESRIIENLKAAELVLLEDDLKRIEGVDRNLRFSTYLMQRDPNIFDTIEDEAFAI